MLTVLYLHSDYSPEFGAMFRWPLRFRWFDFGFEEFSDVVLARFKSLKCEELLTVSLA